MIRNFGIKRRTAALVLTVGMVISLLSMQRPSYAAAADETAEPGELSISEKAEQGTVHEAEGEAIVCFRQDGKAASQKEEAVKEEQEKEIEAESYVDEAEALLMVESPEADLAAADPAEASRDSEGAEPEELLKAGGDSDSDSDQASEIPGVITVVHSDHLTTAELIAELEERDDVIYAEPNYIYSPQETDMKDEQWGNPATSTYGMGIEDWNTYEEGEPKPKVDTSEQVVAVIDTGVDYKHEDLADVMWTDGENYEELVNLGGGKYGYNGARETSDEVPYDPSDPMDDHRHGTHCAGIIAAAWNGYGVSGVTSGARIMAIKASNELGQFSTDAIIRSYNYMITAKKAGVNVCASNNSYGGSAGSQTQNLLVAEAGKNGIVCCFAAGNESVDLDYADNNAPLRASVPQAVIVGASNVDGNITDFSNYGRRDVDVFAPGENILSTVPMGTGTPAADSGAFMDGETPCEVDYSEKTDPDDTALNLSPGSETEMMIQSGEDGKNVLHLTSEDGIFRMETKMFDDLADLKGAFARAYVDGEYNLLILLREIDAEGNIGDDIGNGIIRTKAGWNDIGVSVSAEFAASAKKNLIVQFNIVVARGEISDLDFLNEVDIRTIRLTEEGGNYRFLNGTSMAAPYVTGGVAVLAAAFPEDSAEKLAARVRGSVLPVDEMTDKCLSGGIFRLDKALAGDTDPVVKAASAEGSTVRVKGFFFGEDQGTVRVGGKNCTVTSWSDTEIAAVLPEDIPEGEARIDITSADGNEGHNWFRYSRPKEQYDSLPLPGIPVSDTGMYAVDEEAKEMYNDFYYGTPAAMTALDGSLYVFFESVKNGTVIYRYQIAEQSWERFYASEDYKPKGAVCTWNGKVLFLAENEEKKTNVIGALNPETKGVDWTVYRDDLIEEGLQMVNTGAAIFIIGGKERMDSDPDMEKKITTLRKLDPEEMKISDISGEGFYFEGDDPMIAALSKETFYICSRHETDLSEELELYRITVDPEGSQGVVMEQIEVSEDVFCSCLELDEVLGFVGVATAQGFLSIGQVRVDEEGRIVEDNYMLGYDGQNFAAEQKIISQRPLYMPVAAGCDGKIYVFGMTRGTDAGCAFTAIDADTVPAKEGQELPDHRWDEGTLTEAGVRTYTCIDCGREKKEEIIKTGWVNESGKWYFYDQEGHMLKDAYQKDSSGKLWYLGKDGAWDEKASVTGWKKDGRGWWFGLYGKDYLKNTWKMINGSWYYFKSNGYMAQYEFVKGWWCDKNGVQSDPVKYSWHKTSHGWWYGVSGGWYAKNAAYTIDGRSYTFDKKGYLK